MISGGSAGKGETGILFQKNLIRRLEQQIQEGENRVREKREALEGADRIPSGAWKNKWPTRESQIRESEKRKAELEKIQFGYQEEAKPLQRRLSLIAIEEEETRSLVASENSEEESYRAQEEFLVEEIAVLASRSSGPGRSRKEPGERSGGSPGGFNPDLRRLFGPERKRGSPDPGRVPAPGGLE